MSELIEHSDNGKEPLVNVGDGQSQVSVKVYQDIYHQVTGRTEQIRKRYSQNLRVDFAELQQLHHKVLQLCDVHNVIAHNETISIFHEKERKEQFTSFQRFSAYNANTSSPTISAVFKYNFSIIPAGLARPQEYVVSIRLTSRVAALKQIKEDISAFMAGHVFSLMSKNTAEVTVDYADYVIARGFLEALDEWVAGCKVTPANKTIKLLRRYSHRIPDAAQIIIAVIIVVFSLKAATSFFSIHTSPNIWARFLIIYTGGSYLLLKLVHATSTFIEAAIDSFPELSYLHLNKGDKKLIDEAEASAPWATARFIFWVIGTLVLGIVSAKLERFV